MEEACAFANSGGGKLLLGVAEHGGTELELRYNDFFTAVFAMKSAVTERESQRHAGAEAGPVTSAVGTRLGPSRDQVEILRKCLSEKPVTELLEASGRSNRTKFRDQVLRPLLDQGWLEMTIPDKPTSSKQKYRLTKKGRALMDREGDHE